MSRTLREYKGKKHRQQKERKTDKNPRKHFGFTSGQHTRGVYDRPLKEDGTPDYTKQPELTDRAPVKGVDFIKYSWPFELRSKRFINRKLKEEEDKKEIKGNI